jgi:hypothetical protein
MIPVLLTGQGIGHADGARPVFAGHIVELTARRARLSTAPVAPWYLSIQARHGGVIKVSELSEQVMRWVTDAVGDGAQVAAVNGLREGANPWLLRFDTAGRAEAAVLRLGEPTDPEHCQRFATEVAALRVAGDHELPAARLIATDLDGAAAGALAVLTTVLPGHSQIPSVASTARLRGLGATAAALQSVPLAPRATLPLRTRSIADVDFAAQRREKGTTALLATAEERLDRLPVPGARRSSCMVTCGSGTPYGPATAAQASLTGTAPGPDRRESTWAVRASTPP